MNGAKPLRIRFDRVDGFIRVYDGIRYLVLFDPEKYDVTCNKIIYPIGIKSGIIYIIYLNYTKIKVVSSDSLSLENHILCIML